MPGQPPLLSERKATRGGAFSATGAYAIESALYSGVPRSSGRNLLPSERSVLKEQIGKNRLGRQRLGRLLRRKISPTRFDLLTLQFLEISSRKFSADQKASRERLLVFNREANGLLRRCGMWDVYPVNPYESFLLLCLLTEDPLYTFNDVWQSSYEA